jgi:electron transport complex protein RnfE
VLLGSSLLVSSIKKLVPTEVRISTYILIIATFVTIADMVLEAVVPDVHKELGAFVALIVVNCIILGRQEAFASKNSVGRSLLDAVGMSIGFTATLTVMGTIREVLGAGTFLGHSVFGPHYEPWVIMVLPPGGFFTLGCLLLVFSWVKRRSAARATTTAAPVAAREAA